MFGWTPTWALVDDDAPVVEQLTAPHTPRLGTAECPVEARGGQLALRADGLRPGDVDDVVGEEQVRERAVAVGATGLRGAQGDGRLVDLVDLRLAGVERGALRDEGAGGREGVEGDGGRDL